MKLDKEQKETLQALGFMFKDDRRKQLIRHTLIAIEEYKNVHGNCLVPTGFVVPISASWPAEVHGLPLGSR